MDDSPFRFRRMDWGVAWRHLRVGGRRPAWVVPALLMGAYLLAVGGGLAHHAIHLEGAPEAVLPGFDTGDVGPTAQLAYGLLAAVTVACGAMLLLFAGLSFFFNLLAAVITISVLLGCMALVVVLSLMTGLEADLRSKILDQRGHVRVARPDGRPFGDYRALVEAIEAEPGVAGASAYLEGEIMLRSGLQRQAGILVGVEPVQHTHVSNLPDLVVAGDYETLLHPETIPDPDPFARPDDAPFRLRHLARKRKRASSRKPRQKAAKTSAASEPSGAEPGELGRLPPPPTAVTPPGEGWEDPAAVLGTTVTAGAERARGRNAGGGAPPEGARTPEGGRAGPPNTPDGAGGALTEREPPAEGEGAGRGKVLPALVIGREMEMELGVGVGDRVQLITPIGRLTPAGRMPGVLAARVGAIFYSGMYEFDRKNVYAPLSVVQPFLRAGHRVTGVEVRLTDPDDIDHGKARVQAVVDRLGRAGELEVKDWRDLNRNLFSAMFLEKVAMFVALLFVVLVASFGILASNLMSVMEKAKDIAMMKAMGATDRQILRIFTAEGLVVGLLGSLAGISLGLAMAWALGRFGLPISDAMLYSQDLPVVVDPLEVVLVGLSAIGIVWVSSLYPARVASRLPPVEGLRQGDR